MKQFLFALLILTAISARAQQDSLKIFNAQRVHTTSTGMEVLGSWGLLNLGSGAVGWTSSTNAQTRYFHQMNMIWGGADFLAALFGYTGAQKYHPKSFTAAQTLTDQRHIETIFLINGAFDIGYLATGAYLDIAGNQRNSPIMKGYGTSVLLQGGFLLIFDSLMYRSERRNGNRLRHFLANHPITFNGKQVGVVVPL